jgi:hypothetical protein
MQAVRPAAAPEEEVAAQKQLVREDQAEEKREVAGEAAPVEKDVAVVGEDQAEAEEEEAGASAKKNRIQVSTNKKPLYFYVNLSKVRNSFISRKNGFLMSSVN